MQLRVAPGRIRGNEISVVLPAPLRVSAFRYEVTIEGFGDPVQLVPRGLLDDPVLFSDREGQMGVLYSHEASRFRVFAPTATGVWLVLYDEATGDRGRQEVAMKLRDCGVWEASVPGNLNGIYYTFQIEAPGLSPHNEVVDINAVNTVDSSRRARITDLGVTNPSNWEQTRRGPLLNKPTDAVIYEMHVRDFTVSPSSGVPAPLRGKYLGFALPGMHLPDHPDIKTGIDHLVELGVTHVQLMPVQDFHNEETTNAYNWGYITVNFNSPEGQYASHINDDSRVRELKSLIAALHERGIGVIMDVVYNHTGNSAGFNQTVPGYYYRRTADGHFMNASGCGNDFRSEAPMGRKFIVDSLKYWVKEYGVDGFRFDLMALIDTDTMAQVLDEVRKLRSDILIYGEPWAAGAPSTSKPTDKSALRQLEVGVFNDEFRNNLKGSPEGGEWGYVQGLGNREAIHHGLEGTVKSWVPRASQTINYLTCHDNLVLFDKIRMSRPEASDAEVIDMMKVGYLMVLTAQGVPFLHGGEEFARTKFGNHNSYESPDYINQVDWELKKQNRDLFEWVRDLIALRKAHPIMRLVDPVDVAAVVSFPPSPNGQTVVMKLDAAERFEEPWQAMLVLANSSDREAAHVDLPPGEWVVALDSRRAIEGKNVTGQLDVPPRSGLVLYQARKKN
jgi:pullulanase